MEDELHYIGTKPMERFILFTYDDYYPSGGLQDALYQFDNIDEALEAYKNEKSRYKELFDRVKGLEIDVSSYGLDF